MTLVEFIAPLAKTTNRDKVLAVLYFAHRFDKIDALTVDQIRQKLKSARVPKASKMNVADAVFKSGAYVDTPGTESGKRLWHLTITGEEYVRDLLALPKAQPEIEHDVATLTKLASKIKDEDVKGFVEEALTCLQVGALRAAVVFLWSGAVRTLQNQAFTKGAKAVNAAITKHDPKARAVGRVDDFAYIKDKTFLLAMEALGLVDKSQRGTLEDALDLRNRCGHPTKYRPGEKKASSFIEDVIGIVFT